MTIFNVFSRYAGFRRAGKKKKSSFAPALSESATGKKSKAEEEKRKIEKKNPPAQAGEKPIEKKESTKTKKGAAVIYGIVKEPHISEKSTNFGKVNQYIFKVFPRANKNEIKKAIESIYNVDVLSVNIIMIPSKKRRIGKIIGFKKGYKKAIVRIKEGQKIEIL